MKKTSEDYSPLEGLRELRDNYSDEIPGEVLHGPVKGTNKGNFKVRKNWWHGVIGDLSRLRSKGLVPQEFQDEVRDFIEHYTSDDFRRQPQTTANDLETAKELITKLVGDEA